MVKRENANKTISPIDYCTPQTQRHTCTHILSQKQKLVVLLLFEINIQSKHSKILKSSKQSSLESVKGK